MGTSHSDFLKESSFCEEIADIMKLLLLRWVLSCVQPIHRQFAGTVTDIADIT